MLGTFYKAPKPGAPPFAEVGSFVKEEDTLCIIEVMKLFNTVKAGLRGRIARVCAEQGQMVEFNQTLFWVESDAERASQGQERMKGFSRVLVANRSEIAVRIIRACRKLGIQTVLAASEADRESLAARLADRVVCIGPPSRQGATCA